MEVIENFFIKIKENLEIITNMVTTFFDFFKDLVNLIPYPFGSIILSVIAIVIAIIAVRIITG